MPDFSVTRMTLVVTRKTHRNEILKQQMSKYYFISSRVHSEKYILQWQKSLIPGGSIRGHQMILDACLFTLPFFLVIWKSNQQEALQYGPQYGRKEGAFCKKKFNIVPLFFGNVGVFGRGLTSHLLTSDNECLCKTDNQSVHVISTLFSLKKLRSRGWQFGNNKIIKRLFTNRTLEQCYYRNVVDQRGPGTRFDQPFPHQRDFLDFIVDRFSKWSIISPPVLPVSKVGHQFPNCQWLRYLKLLPLKRKWPNILSGI